MTQFTQKVIRPMVPKLYVPTTYGMKKFNFFHECGIVHLTFHASTETLSHGLKDIK
jgi:hypothetical protein